MLLQFNNTFQRGCPWIQNGGLRSTAVFTSLLLLVVQLHCFILDQCRCCSGGDNYPHPQCENVLERQKMANSEFTFTGIFHFLLAKHSILTMTSSSLIIARVLTGVVPSVEELECACAGHKINETGFSGHVDFFETGAKLESGKALGKRWTLQQCLWWLWQLCCLPLDCRHQLNHASMAALVMPAW